MTKDPADRNGWPIVIGVSLVAIVLAVGLIAGAWDRIAPSKPGTADAESGAVTGPR